MVVEIPRVLKQFLEVIVRHGACWERRAPVTPVVTAVNGSGREVAGRCDAVVAETVRGLQRILAVDVVDVQIRRKRVARRTCAATFRCDQDDTVGGALPINGGRSGALQNFDAFNICGIHVNEAVRRDGAAGRRLRRVIDRHAVDDEQRLTVTLQRFQAANGDRRARARLARARGDGHARRFR